MPGPYFKQLAEGSFAGAEELQRFIDGVVRLLEDLISGTVKESGDWKVSAVLQEVLDSAEPTFEADVRPWFNDVRKEIPNISEAMLDAHGLRGRALGFKFKVLDIIERALDAVDLDRWIKMILAAIDVILESVLDAVTLSGVPIGTLGKEFKQMIEAAVT